MLNRSVLSQLHSQFCASTNLESKVIRFQAGEISAIWLCFYSMFHAGGITVSFNLTLAATIHDAYYYCYFLEVKSHVQCYILAQSWAYIGTQPP